MINRKNLFYVAVVMAVAVIAALSIVVSTRSSDTRSDTSLKTGITLSFAPYDSVVTINGQKTGEGSIELSPGQYTIIASRQGFEAQKQTITIKDGDHYNIAFVLQSNTEATANYYDLNEDDARKAEAISGQKSEAVGVSQVNSLPLIKKLPKVEKGRYKITYGDSVAHPDDSSKVALYVDYTDDAAKTAANNWITYQGYDPTKLEIIYRLTTNI